MIKKTIVLALACLIRYLSSFKVTHHIFLSHVMVVRRYHIDIVNLYDSQSFVRQVLNDS